MGDTFASAFFPLPFHGPLLLATSHSRFVLAPMRNKKSEEEAARSWKWRIISLEFLCLLLRRYFGCFLRLTNRPKITFSSSFQPPQGFHELKTGCLWPLKQLNSAKCFKIYATCQQLNRKKSFILWNLILLERPWSPSIYNENFKDDVCWVTLELPFAQIVNF